MLGELTGTACPNVVDLPTAVPGVHAFRATTEEKRNGIKPYFAVGRIDSGNSEWWSRGKVFRSGPGSVLVKEMGDVHRDLALSGPTSCTIVSLPAEDVAFAREAGVVVASPQIEPDDPQGAVFHRLLDAVVARAERLTIEVALAEAVAMFGRMSTVKQQRTRPVQRAVDYLRACLGEAITLDDIARHAGLDKFHLCRAFRAQIGMPPHAYLTHLRIQRARELLLAGVRASEIAPRVGLYDQSLLNRHFRRIMGTTPARYARRER